VRYSDLYYNSISKIKKIQKKTPFAINPSLDIEILIEKAFHLSKSRFWLKKNDQITDKNRLNNFYRYLKRLEKAEPIAFIIKEKEFFSEIFYINQNVLIPRPETEILVEKAIKNIMDSSDILDIGSGCGNISIILAKTTKSRLLATEINSKALYVLKKNIALHSLKNKVVPQKADLFPRKYRQFDMIVSNPPYLSEDEWSQLPAAIKNFEPKAALVSGSSGYETISRIVRQSKKYLKPNGVLLIEMGHQQKNIVQKLLENTHFKNINFFKDYSNIYRIAFAQK